MKNLLLLLVLFPGYVALAQKGAPQYLSHEKVYVSSPDITPLPFGPGMKKKEDLGKAGAGAFINLIGKNLGTEDAVFTPTYILRDAPKTRYTAIDPDVNEVICYGYNPDSLFTVAKYKFRLPDYKGIQVFYMTNDALLPPERESVELSRQCTGYVYNYYGNLVAYNPKTRTANVITIFQSKFSDWPHDRLFFIDKDYTIYIADFTADDGGEGEPVYAGPSYKVTISANGEFVVESLK